MKKTIQSPFIVSLSLISTFALTPPITAMEELDPTELIDHNITQGQRHLRQHWSPDDSPPRETAEAIDRRITIRTLATNGFISEDVLLQTASLFRIHQNLQTPQGLARALKLEYGIPEGYAPDIWQVIASKVINADADDQDPLDPQQELVKAAAPVKRRLDDQFMKELGVELTVNEGLSSGEIQRIKANLLEGQSLNGDDLDNSFYGESLILVE